MAAKLNITVHQGETFRYKVTWNDSDNAPIDLTGRTARMQIREDVDSDTVVHELTTENGGITLGGVTGEIDLLINADDTSAFTIECGVYDLEIVTPGTPDDVTRLLQGRVTVTKEVTR